MAQPEYGPLYHQVWNIHLLLAEGPQKGGDDIRIKLVAGSVLQNLARLKGSAALAIWTSLVIAS